MVGPTILSSTASDSGWKKRQERSIDARVNEKSPGQVRHTFHKSIQRQRKKRHISGSVKQRGKLNNHKNGLRRGKLPTSQSHETSDKCASEGWKFKKQEVNCRSTWKQLSAQESRIGDVPKTSGKTWKRGSQSASSESEPSDEEEVLDCFRKKPNDQNPLSQPASSHPNSRDHNCPTFELKRHGKVKIPQLTYADEVKQPKIVLKDCLKSLGINIQPTSVVPPDLSSQKTKRLRKISILNKSTRTPSNCDEFRTEDSGDGQRLAGTQTPFHVPTWRQLTIQQAGSLEVVNTTLDCESSKLNQTKKCNHPSIHKRGEKRKINKSGGQTFITVPTWRQLTKQLSGFSEYKSELKDNMGSSSTSSLPKVALTKFTESEKFKMKKKRWPLPEVAQPQTDSQSQLNQLPKKHRGIGSRVNTSELYHESQISETISDHSNSEEKSLESYYKHKRSAPTDTISAKQVKLPKAKSVSLKTRSLQLPTIKILLLSNTSSVCYEKETSVTTKEMPIIIKNTKEAPTVLPNHPEPSTLNRNGTSFENKITTVQHEIPLHGGGEMATLESEPSGSSDPAHTAMTDLQKEKPHYECTMCDYRGSHLGMIWNHILGHKMQDNGVKPYACDECDYRAKSENLLKSHKITHAGERPYPCDRCDRRCRSNTHLRIHKILHHNEKPYECRECDFKCADERLFRAHLRNHPSVGANRSDL